MPVTVHTVGDVAVVTFDRSDKANALSLCLMAGLATAASEAAGEHRVLVVAGAGGTFCGGADLTDLRADPVGLQAALSSLRATLLGLPVPLLAAIEGPCVGGGLDLAMACDVRLASSTARFAIPAARLGVAYPEEGLTVFRRRLPHQTLARLFLMGETIGAEDAVVAGIVSQVVGEGGAVGAALALASSVGGLDAATLAATRGRL